ncbi:MAG: type IX secretion system protein PorQ [Paludibacteraceae bacterium]
MKRNCILIVLLSLCVLAYPQAGDGTFKLLDLPSSARVAAMGGTNVAMHDDDVNFSAMNPALLSEKTHNMLSFNYSNYFYDINFGSVLYGRNFGDKNYTAFGAHYLDYGKFLETSETNELLGSFTAKDIMLSASYARLLHPRWTIGLSFKPMISIYERYQTYGFSFDVGVGYADTKHNFYAGLAFRNVGMSVANYRSLDGQQSIDMLPWNIELALVKGFKHAPIRISMTAHNWQRWNLGYTDDTVATKEKSINKAASFFDMLFRHTIFNLEILPTKNIYLLVSYNHRRQMEMNVNDYKTAAGLSFGAGIKVYKFHIDAGFAQYQVGRFSFHATFTTYLSEFGVK